MVLTTGRQLEHWHTGAITRRAGVLDALEPEAVASLSPADLGRLGCGGGRAGADLDPAGGDRARGEARPGDPGGNGVRALLLRGGGGQRPHQPGAGPHRQDPRLQALRGARRTRRVGSVLLGVAPIANSSTTARRRSLIYLALCGVERKMACAAALLAPGASGARDPLRRTECLTLPLEVQASRAPRRPPLAPPPRTRPAPSRGTPPPTRCTAPTGTPPQPLVRQVARKLLPRPHIVSATTESSTCSLRFRYFTSMTYP